MVLLRVEQQGKVSPTRMELELHIADAHWVEEERLHHLGRYLIVINDGDEERPRGSKHSHVLLKNLIIPEARVGAVRSAIGREFKVAQ